MHYSYSFYCVTLKDIERSRGGMDIWGEWSSAWVQGHLFCSTKEIRRPRSEALHGDILNFPLVCTQVG